MIAIINQGKKNKAGETLYNLQINNKLITTFYHYRELGLRRCLERAAIAMEPIESKELMEHVGKILTKSCTKTKHLHYKAIEHLLSCPDCDEKL
ncbi:unnamed protein product [marine sediment metagenome]|uniref:Uncharacterized protein n=1 Tax=marine sediment metagenome TaxID=412755 RepID=X1DXS7_9ZZZZ